MITSMAVGATFEVVDRASPTLLRLAEQLERTQALADRTQAALDKIGSVRFGGLSQSLGGLERRLDTVSVGAERMAQSFAAAGEAMTASIAAASERIAAMGAEMRGITTASRSMAPAIASSGSGVGGGRHGGSLTSRFHAGPVGGHFAVNAGVGAGLVGGYGLYEGLRYAGQEERAIRFALMADQIDPNSARGQMLAAQLSNAAMQAAHGTPFARADVAAMTPEIVGMSGRTVEEILPFLPTAMKYADYERQIGQSMGQTWEAKESAASLIRVGHSFGITDPDKFAQIANLLVPATQTAHASPQQLGNILQYMTSPARGLGMKPQEVVEMAAAGSLLFPGTRAGTNTGMMLQRLEQIQSGPLPGASAARRHQLESWTKTAVQMGLVDPHSHQLFRDQSGDMVRPLFQHLQQYEYTHPGQAAGMFQQLFETRGGRAAFEFGQGSIPALLDALIRRESQFPGIDKAQGTGMDLMYQRAGESFARLKDVLNDMASPLVPSLTTAFQGLGSVFTNLDTYLKAHPNMGATGDVVTGGAGLLAIWGAISRFTSIPGPLAAWPAWLAALSAGGGYAAYQVGPDAAHTMATGTYDNPGGAPYGMPSDAALVQVVNAERAGRLVRKYKDGDPFGGEWMGGTGNVAPPMHGTIQGGDTARGVGQPIQNITNNLSVSVQGVTIEEIVAKVIAAVTGLLHTAIGNNTGTAGGAQESAYTSGGDTAVGP